MKSSQDVEASWAKFLNPDSLKQNLLQGGLYLAAFEMLKDSLVGRPRDFYCIGFVEGELETGAEYARKVLALHKHPYTASALWWHNLGAISENDLETLSLIREHRDKIAHNMPKMIATSEHSIDLGLLATTCAMLTKLDNWWIQNFEAEIDPESYKQFNQEEMDNAASMSAIFLSMMIPLVSGDDSQFRTLYAMWCDQQTKPKEGEH